MHTSGNLSNLRYLFAFAVCVWGIAQAAPLTLDAVLAETNATHPELAAATAREALVQAEQEMAESLNDFRLTLEAGLRSGHNPLYRDSFHPDHLARLNLKKPLWDSGQTDAVRLAADLERRAARYLGADVRAQRRVALMARFFDVLLADMEFNAVNEFSAVAYVRWDNGKDLHQLGQISTPQLAELEGRFQELRRQRLDVERRAREKRALLASRMNRPGELPSELAEPALKGQERALPEFDALLKRMQENNPRLAALRLQLDAARQRLAAVRQSDGPRLELEAETAAYSRDASTRDTLRGGFNFVWPISQGRRSDGEIAREQARLQQIQASYDLLLLQLRQELYELSQEIAQLREVERKSLAVQVQQRDWALERARAEYELELKTNLGDSMAETQRVRWQQRAIEYRLALAWARLSVLLGGELEEKK